MCRNAFAVSYVTESFLQKRYPPSPLSFCTHFSSIDLLPSFFSLKKRVSIKREYPVLINCSMMQKKIKGQDIFLKTIYLLKQKGFFAQGILVGGGDHSTYFKNLANSLGIQRQIRFVGLLPSGSRISRIMDQADFYISPSRQEGLPRSVIEAMARSLPCLASNV
ncbi:MAG: glycosyltransferase family 4 protein, partial [Verrucomicrobia bacterium]|nr:glycosyltransferase family 4 protein [Verrucomicrobiota bacterium]